MQFLVIADFKDGPKPDNFDALLGQEVQAARRSYGEGSLRQVWQQDPGDGAVAILEADSVADAQAIMSRWPLEQVGLLDARLIGLKPFGGFGPRKS